MTLNDFQETIETVYPSTTRLRCCTKKADVFKISLKSIEAYGRYRGHNPYIIPHYSSVFDLLIYGGRTLFLRSVYFSSYHDNFVMVS